MENFNVNLTITDSCYSNSCKYVNEKSTVISSISTLVPLQDDFSLRIIAVTNTKVTFEIKKSYVYFVRFGYVNVDTKICLPCGNCCSEHMLNIHINSIEI